MDSLKNDSSAPCEANQKARAAGFCDLYDCTMVQFCVDCTLNSPGRGSLPPKKKVCVL